MTTPDIVQPGLVAEKDAKSVDYRYRSFLEPGETVVWTESGGGSGSVGILFNFAFLALAVILFAAMYASGIEITSFAAQIILYVCLACGFLANTLLRGRNDTKHEYVLADRRLVIGNLSSDSRAIFMVTDEASRASISRIEVRSPSSYERVRVFVEAPDEKRVIQLLDQEKPAEVAQLIRSTFGIS